jgi:hypothetical protein
MVTNFKFNIIVGMVVDKNLCGKCEERVFIYTPGEGLHIMFSANAKAQAKVGGIPLRILQAYLFMPIQQVLRYFLLYLLLVKRMKLCLNNTLTSSQDLQQKQFMSKLLFPSTLVCDLIHCQAPGIV